ncbi:hypothetical protein JCM10212_001528 [Sporobolomyces blumeae]
MASTASRRRVAARPRSASSSSSLPSSSSSDENERVDEVLRTRDGRGSVSSSAQVDDANRIVMRSWKKHHHSGDGPSLLKRIKRIASCAFLAILIGGIAWAVYYFGGPTAVYEEGRDFVTFPTVTTPVDVVGAATSVFGKVTEGAVSVATQAFDGATSVANVVGEGAQGAAETAVGGIKDGANAIGDAFKGIGIRGRSGIRSYVDTAHL